MVFLGRILAWRKNTKIPDSKYTINRLKIQFRWLKKHLKMRIVRECWIVLENQNFWRLEHYLCIFRVVNFDQIKFEQFTINFLTHLKYSTDESFARMKRVHYYCIRQGYQNHNNFNSTRLAFLLNRNLPYAFYLGDCQVGRV